MNDAPEATVEWPTDQYGQPLILIEVDVPYLSGADHTVIHYLRGAYTP